MSEWRAFLFFLGFGWTREQKDRHHKVVARWYAWKYGLPPTTDGKP